MILNSNLEVVKEMKPSSSAPGEFKELTDFFIWEDYLYIYDFQSQKFKVWLLLLQYSGNGVYDCGLCEQKNTICRER